VDDQTRIIFHLFAQDVNAESQAPSSTSSFKQCSTKLLCFQQQAEHFISWSFPHRSSMGISSSWKQTGVLLQGCRHRCTTPDSTTGAPGPVFVSFFICSFFSHAEDFGASDL